MQTPAAFDANIDFIIEDIKHFAAEGDVVDVFQANQHHHFLQSAQRTLTDWRTSKPYHKTYAKEAELALIQVEPEFARQPDPN